MLKAKGNLRSDTAPTGNTGTAPAGKYAERRVHGIVNARYGPDGQMNTRPRRVDTRNDVNLRSGPGGQIHGNVNTRSKR